MAEHPRVVDPAHPLIERVRGICLDYPEAVEVEGWGRPTFRARTKIFVLCGSMDHPLAVTIKPTPDELPAYRQNPRFWAPKYWTHQGWVSTSLEDADWREIAELVDTSYRQVALVRQLKQLDSKHPTGLV